MLVFPSAKLNIGLQVGAKRKDGYHDIDTLFYPIGIHDGLEVTETTSANSLSISGLATGTDLGLRPEDNLVWRAYALLAAEHSLPNLRIHLHKGIPHGAGLGGGSSDAAWMLRLLNDRFSLGLSVEALSNYACQLGSDVSFFLRDAPHYGLGRGERLQEAPALLKGVYAWVLVPKTMRIATPEAYAQLGRRGLAPRPPLFKAHQAPRLAWQEAVINDFEAPLLAAYPQAVDYRDCLKKAGAWYVSLSGSGSAFYGLFDSRPTGESPSGCLSYIQVL